MKFALQHSRDKKIMRPSRLRWGLRRNTDGVAAIEFAFTVPV
ncbi:MAG: Flp pilus assembly protein TadG, partial [Alphaproteobacteria bacterium]